MNRDRTGPHFEALAEIENELKVSSLNYTIIKPSFFMDNFLRITKVEDGEIYIPEFINRDVKFAMISSIDIARIAANIFANTERFNHQAIEIASDELTLNEVVKHLPQLQVNLLKLEVHSQVALLNVAGLKRKVM